MADIRTKEEERERIRKLIAEWNASRLDIFEISEPNEDLEFRGVMRFFFQDSGSKVATKCIRVSSNETSTDVTNTLVEKFRPDMKMLSQAKYALYEVHPSGGTRALASHEKPLQVQLAWQEDDREGRFLLKSDKDKVNTENLFGTEPNQNFKRKLSKREKKQLKKKKEEEQKKGKDSKAADDSLIAKGLYDELPETSFTRSISNPEAVMRRRRQQKLEKRLKEFQSQDGGQDSGGTLKIFATTLKPEIPYKTLLVAMHATATQVVKDALEKYQMEKEDPEEYCLVMVNIPPEGPNGANTLGKERVVPDQDCPLGIAATWPANLGTVVFHLRRRANLPKYRREKRERRSKSPSRVPFSPNSDHAIGERLAAPAFPEHLLPYLLELSPDGQDLNRTPHVHRLQMGVTEVGSDRSSSGPFIQLFAPHIRARHCVITNIDGVVSIVPSSSDAETSVDGRRIYETTKLSHGKVVKFGRAHVFKFADPAFDEKAKQQTPSVSDRGSDQASISSISDTDLQKRGRAREYEAHHDVDMGPSESGVFETTFDVTGEIKTNTTFPEREKQPPQVQENLQMTHSFEDLEQDSADGDKLPARLEFREVGEDAFFAVVISEVNGAAVHFKLSPTYTLYMCCRYRMSPAYRPDLSPDQHGERLGVTLVKIGNIVRSTIRENSQMPASLAFWIANSSEMLHFLKEDRDISPHTRDGQQILASSIQMAFRSLVHCVQQELKSFMSAFLDETDDADIADMDFESMTDPDSPEHGMTANERSFRFPASGRPLGSEQWLGARRRHPKPTLSDVLYTLSSAMSLLRRCRVNAAITIQVFTHLFHYINMWIFNKLVLQPHHGLCSRAWGRKLRKRLARVETWAQKQGLELAADRHLSRIIQAAHLLQAPKNSHSDIDSISSTCFKLNSYQLRALLENYIPGLDEPDIPMDLINSVVAVAENTADELMRSNGQEVQLEEDPELQLPFLLPEDGYSCDVIRGVPPGLKEFLEPLASTGLCNLIVQPMASGLWTVYQKIPKETRPGAPKASSPEVVEVAFNKGRGGMGLSIVAAKGAGQDKPGIYVKQVVKDGPAARDGRLQAGDQLVTVNGESLVGVSQERAAELMVKSGANVKLLVAKQGAIFHGLATLLSQPSPMVTREVTGKLTPVEPESAQLVQASPTVPEDQLQRPPTRWLQHDGIDTSYKPRSERDLRAEEERRRLEEEGRRRVEEEQERLEDERRRAEEDERRREEARKLEEERRFAEERRKAEEKRRYAEETQRLEEMRQERRSYNGDWRPQVDDRRRGEEAMRRFHSDTERPAIRPKPRPAQVQESLRASKEHQRSPAAFSFENVNRERGLYTSPPTGGSPRSYSPNEDTSQSPEEPSSPLRIDARDTKFGRAIAIRPSGLRSPTQSQRPTDIDQFAQAETWQRNEQSEFERWQREERQLADKREREMEERERREQEERAWREKMDRERALQEERDKWERERLNRERLERERLEREKEERQRQEERDRQALQAMMEEQRREKEQFEKREREEREERERQEEERIMNQLQGEEQDLQDHTRRPEREQEQFLSLEQQRWKSSKEMLDSIESMNPDEVEKEFQRRLQEDKRRRDTGDASVVQERSASGLVSIARVQYHPPDREEQMERERKIQLILEEREKRERERKENDRRRKLQEEKEEKERRERQQRRMQQFEMEREQQREMQKKLQEQREREQAEWLRLQKEKREQQRNEQERQRMDQKIRDEEERNRKRQELLQKKEQNGALRRQSQQQKEEEEKRFAEEQRQNEIRREQERRRQFEEQQLLREKEEQVRRQQVEDERVRESGRKVSTEDHVNELKQRALVDYDRRRELIDEELTRRREDKPPSVLKNSNSMRPRKQVSFSNVATEIREPSSPTYVVGNSAGYTARVTPAASVRYVHTRLPSDGGVPNQSQPPAPKDDEDDLPPPPPPPPPEELLNDDLFPPPPPPKSSHSLQRFTALSGGDRSPSNYYPGSPYDTRNHADAFQLSQPRDSYNSSSEVQYRNIPVSSTGPYPSYITMPRRARPLSYPAALDAAPPPAPQRYGSQENMLDEPSYSQSGRPRFQPPQAARLDSDDDDDAVDRARVSMARVSLTDEEKTRGPAKPEKMDFRDKLKMFNTNSPQDKVRTSKWQRNQLAQMNGD